MGKEWIGTATLSQAQDRDYEQQAEEQEAHAERDESDQPIDDYVHQRCHTSVERDPKSGRSACIDLDTALMLAACTRTWPTIARAPTTTVGRKTMSVNRNITAGSYRGSASGGYVNVALRKSRYG